MLVTGEIDWGGIGVISTIVFIIVSGVVTAATFVVNLLLSRERIKLRAELITYVYDKFDSKDIIKLKHQEFDRRLKHLELVNN
jgi:hypothetical protein